jgi:hypothetical protein
MAEISITVKFVNNTDRFLALITSNSYDYSVIEEWATRPPESIPPQTTRQWESASDGAPYTKGRCTYNIQDGNAQSTVNVEWSSQDLGWAECGVSRDDLYDCSPDRGEGANPTMMVFTLSRK